MWRLQANVQSGGTRDEGQPHGADQARERTRYGHQLATFIACATKDCFSRLVHNQRRKLFDCQCDVAVFLIERMTALTDEAVLPTNWEDFADTWQALLNLRSELECQRAQKILDCIRSFYLLHSRQ